LNTYVIEFTRTGGLFPLSFGNDGVEVSFTTAGAAIISTSFVPNSTTAPWTVNPGASSDQGKTFWLDAAGPGDWADGGTLAVQYVMSAVSVPVTEFAWSYLFEIANNPGSVVENGTIQIAAVPEPEGFLATVAGLLFISVVARRYIRRPNSN